MPKVAVAISNFRSDDSVIVLLETILGENWDCATILIVDSLGSGAIPRYLGERGLCDRVLYRDHPVNLGSAGNLHMRLTWGAELGMDFVLALNHDAVVNLEVYRALVDEASRLDNVGVLYPLRFREGKGFYDLTGTSAFSFGARGTREKPAAPLIEVYWGSSNGALYAVPPVARGITPDASLWLGWEDLLYGLQLSDAGYRQYIVTAAATVDHYEYKETTFLGKKRKIMDKPLWYNFYNARNMLLISLFRAPSPARVAKVMVWLVLAALQVLLVRFKEDGLRSFCFFARGVAAGLTNSSGKWKCP